MQGSEHQAEPGAPAGAGQLRTEGGYGGGGQAEPWEALTRDLSEGARGGQESGCHRRMTVASPKGWW